MRLDPDGCLVRRHRASDITIAEDTGAGETANRQRDAMRHTSAKNAKGCVRGRQGHSVFVEALHDRFPEAIKGCVRGGALLARHPPHEPQPSPMVEPDDNTSTSAH